MELAKKAKSGGEKVEGETKTKVEVGKVQTTVSTQMPSSDKTRA